MRGKVKTFKEILGVVRRAKTRGQKIVTTNGCFDILHIGHLKNLERAKSLGDILIVGINSDKTVRVLKGRGRPVVPERDRAELLAGLWVVDYVFIFREKTPIDWLRKIKPNVHVKGSDGVAKKILGPILRLTGTKLVLVPLIKDKSTTKIIKRISKL